LAAKKTLKPRHPAAATVPDDVEIEIAEIGEDRLAIVSWPVVPRSRSSSLSTAEEAVLRGVALGKSNAEIAKERGTSPRTVANQVAGLLRKYGVSSRYELVLAITRGYDA
jgi:DNA-binding NarL/FixJ family response regulator